jgi:hypothetical protein
VVLLWGDCSVDADADAVTDATAAMLVVDEECLCPKPRRRRPRAMSYFEVIAGRRVSVCSSFRVFLMDICLVGFVFSVSMRESEGKAMT